MYLYQKIIVYICFIVIIILFIFMGFVYGGAKVCQDMGGYLNDKLKCLPLPEQIQQYDIPKENISIKINVKNGS